MSKHPAKRRSAVTNGTRLFAGPTPLTSEARRFADLLAQAENERGGRAAMNVSQQQAARQWAALSVRCEQLHEAIARGDPVEPETLGQIGDRMDRQARAMGPVKVAKPHDIRTHIAARRAGGQA